MISKPSPYQVIVDYYHAPAWHGPMENAEIAHERYALECGRIHTGGIRTVALCKHGVIVAISNPYAEYMPTAKGGIEFRLKETS